MYVYMYICNIDALQSLACLWSAAIIHYSIISRNAHYIKNIGHNWYSATNRMQLGKYISF